MLAMLVLTELTTDQAYVTGFIIGDGSLSQKGYLIRAVEENEDFMQQFAEIFGIAFGKKPKIYFDKFNNSYVAYVYSKKIWEILVNEIKISQGDKSRIAFVPQKILEADDAVKTAFLSGLFDAEGSVVFSKDKKHPNGYLKIQFKVTSKELARQVFELLKSLGLSPVNYDYEGFSLVYLNGKTQGRLFRDKIGFKHPAKKGKLAFF